MMKYRFDPDNRTEALLAFGAPDLFSTEAGGSFAVRIDPSRSAAHCAEEGGVQVFSAPEKSLAFRLMMRRACFGETELPAPCLKMRAVMLDFSRSAVVRPERLKALLGTLALCGYNQFWMYMEDVYPAPEGFALVGYGRGAYTESELRELDDCADALGIELIPCIQTLGHFEQVLRYGHLAYLQDNPRVLNVRLEQTYDFVGAILDRVSACFRTRSVHIGCDEPWGLGRGKTWHFSDPLSPADCFVRHLQKTAALCAARGLHPIMWGDYLLGHSGETALSPAQLAALPRALEMVYWDYDNTDPARYDENIAAFRQAGFEPVCAPSGHGHNRFFPDRMKFDATTPVFLDRMRRNRVTKTVLTLWGDDGHECLLRYQMPQIFAFADGCFGSEIPTELPGECTHDAARCLSHLTELGIFTHGLSHDFELTGKMVLYDDPVFCTVLKMADLASGRIALEALEVQEPLGMAFKAFLLQKIDFYNRLHDGDYTADRAALVSALETLESFFMTAAETERKWEGLEILAARFAALHARYIRLFRALDEQDESLLVHLRRNCYPADLQRDDVSFYDRIASRCYQLWR